MNLVIAEPPTMLYTYLVAQLSNRLKVIKWSNQEIDLLKKTYPISRVKEFANKFPVRTKSTIVAKALSLNLPSAKLWQSGENDILQKNFAYSPQETIQKLLPRRSWPAILAQAERLGLKRITNKPRRSIDERYFEKWSANMAYVLGFIVADGCIVKGTYKGYSDAIKFGVHVKDRDILEKIKLELKSGHSISTTKNATHLSITSQKVVNDLKSLGVSYRKSLCEIMSHVPSAFTRDFIRGIVDGDGSLWLDRQNHPVLSVSGGEKTTRFIREQFFKKFGLYSTLTKCSYSKKVRRHLYSISYRSSSAKTLIKYLYHGASLSLNRKHSIARTCFNSKIRKRNNTAYRLKRYHETYTR